MTHPLAGKCLFIIANDSKPDHILTIPCASAHNTCRNPLHPFGYARRRNQPNQHTIARQQASSYGAIRSRPFLVGLLEKGEIPFRKVGSHRRVRLTDVLAYKETDAQQRKQTLDKLAKLSQEEDMGH